MAAGPSSLDGVEARPGGLRVRLATPPCDGPQPPPAHRTGGAHHQHHSPLCPVSVAVRQLITDFAGSGGSKIRSNSDWYR
jgi:hypothetical protein